jgi:hypothetical protein
MSNSTKNLYTKYFTKHYEFKFTTFKNMEMSGYKFKNEFPNFQPMKIINNNGLVYDVNSSIIDKNKLHNFIKNENKVAYVNLLDNSKIFIDNDKIKVDKFVVTSVITIDDYLKTLSNNKIVQLLKINPDVIKYIKYPTKKMKKVVIKQNGLNICFINECSRKLQKMAIKQNSYAIQYIKNPTEKMQELSIRKNWLSIQYIKNPSEKMIELAMMQRLLAL